MKKTLLTLALTSALSATAMADVRINGFGNINAGITSSDDTFAGYDDNIDFRNGSLFAIQVSGDINEKVSATAQILARGSDDFDPSFEWAYLNYQINDSWSAKAGRFRLPLFAYSDSLDVAYSYHWVTAPSSVYDVAFNNIDGVQFSHTTTLGSWDVNSTVSYGVVNADVFDSPLTAEDTLVASTEFSNDTLKLRGVLGRTTSTLDLTQATTATPASLGAGFEAIESAGFAELADNLRLEDDTGTFVGLSAMYDNFDYFAGAEFTKISNDNAFANDDKAYYVTAGARFGKFTPSITYERFESSGEVKYGDQIAAIATSELPAEVAQSLTAIAAGAQLAQLSEYDIISIAGRFDLDNGVALKGDLSKVINDNDESLDATLLRVGINFVF